MIKCPSRVSTYHLAKSLGSEADISSGLKEKIRTTQAIDNPSSKAPSKSYHITTGAFMACELIGRGVDPGLAVTIQKMAVWSYRTLRMNLIIKNDLKRSKLLSDMYQGFLKEFNKNESQFLTIEQWVLKNKNKIINDEEFNISYLQEMKLESAKSVDDIFSWLAKYDAALLLDQEGLGGWSAFGLFDIPHTNLSLNFANGFKVKLDNKLRKKRMRGQSRSIKGLSGKRKKYAVNKANTYLVDWEWTTKQHEVGAMFAAKNCKREKRGLSLDDQLCDKQPEDGCGELKNRPSNREGVQLIDAKTTGFVNNLENLKGKSNKQYLEPGLEVKKDGDQISINGVY